LYFAGRKVSIQLNPLWIYPHWKKKELDPSLYTWDEETIGNKM